MWPILNGLSPVDRRQLLRSSTRRRFRRDEVIFHEGDPGEAVHLIESGRVAIRVTTPLGDVSTFTVLGPGDFFGELALILAGGRRTATAACLDPVETLALSRPVFSDLRAAHSSVATLVESVLANRVERLSARLVEALYVPVNRRILNRLLELAELEDVRDGTIRITQEDLATLAGTTRSTVNRALRTAETAGGLTVARGRVQIHDSDLLKRTLGGRL